METLTHRAHIRVPLSVQSCHVMSCHDDDDDDDDDDDWPHKLPSCFHGSFVELISNYMRTSYTSIIVGELIV